MVGLPVPLRLAPEGPVAAIVSVNGLHPLILVTPIEATQPVFGGQVLMVMVNVFEVTTHPPSVTTQ